MDKRHSISRDNLEGGSRQSQEHEALLSHLLCLERERRVRAEQLVERELQVCLRLRHLLEREKKRNVVPPAVPSGRVETERERRLSQANKLEEEEVKEKKGNEKRSNSLKPPPPTDHLPLPSLPSPAGSSSPSTLSGFSDDFSSSVFSQLPGELRDILHVTPEAKSKSVLTQATEAIKSNDVAVLQSCLASLGREVLSTSDGTTLLELACQRCHGSSVSVLLAAGCNPNVSDREDGMTVLHMASRTGNAGTLQLLLDHGADARLADRDDQSALFLALCSGHLSCAEQLLKSGSCLDTETKTGYSPLHAAVLGNLPSALRLLLVHIRTSFEGSKVAELVNHLDKDLRTALHIAAAAGHRGCVEVLCGSPEVDTALRDRWNRTALDVAAQDCKELLLNKESKKALVTIELPAVDPGSAPQPLTIGTLSILRHHRLSDVEPLVDCALEEFCHHLHSFSEVQSSKKDGHSNSSNSFGGGGSRIPKASNIVRRATEKQREVQEVVVGYDSEMPYGAEEKESVGSSGGGLVLEAIQRELKVGKEELVSGSVGYLRQQHRALSYMDLEGPSCVGGYRVRTISWKRGELKSTGFKNLFSMIGEREAEPLEVFVTLKGAEEGCLDELACQLMVPAAQLKSYVDLIEQHKTLILHGAQGSGKTFLARHLAGYLRTKLGADRTQLIHMSLHPSVQRNDFFRMLHINGLLVQVGDLSGGEAQTSRSGSAQALQPRAHVVILDDISQVTMPAVLAELLTCLEYRGPAHPMWINEVYSREGHVIYPSSQYYLKERSYFICTRTHTSVNGLGSVVVDQFPHVSLGLTAEPCAGVVHRWLLARLLHAQRGATPHKSDSLYRLVQWVCQVWMLYNRLMMTFDLPELTTGVRHILTCPIESHDLDVICKWLCSMWTHQLVPAIDSASTTRFHHQQQQHQQPLSFSLPVSNQPWELTNLLITAALRSVFEPLCPLHHEATQQLLDTLGASRQTIEETALARMEMTPVGDGNDDDDGASDMAASDSTLQPSGQELYSPPAPSPPSHAPSETMVTYEDMIKNSPRNAPKSSGKPVKAKVKTERMFSLEKPPKPPRPQGNEPKAKRSLEASKSSTLRKLRSKTFSLFSNKDGTSTLPRLFRRGSKNSLSQSSEDKPSPQSSTSERKGGGSRQLEELFGAPSNASGGDQQMTPPSSSSRQRGGGKKNPKELDEFLDLLSEVGQDRIDDQRSPPVEEKAFKLRVVQSKRPPIPSYFLPTGSPKKEKQQKRRSVDTVASKKKSSSSNCQSMPDLLADSNDDDDRTDQDYRLRTNTYTTGCKPVSVEEGDVDRHGGTTLPPIKGSASVDVLGGDNGSRGGKGGGAKEGKKHRSPLKQRVSIATDTPLEGTASEPTKRRFKFRRSKNKDKHQPVHSTKSTPGAVPRHTSTSPLAATSYTKTTSPLGYAVTTQSQDAVFPYSEHSTESSSSQLEQEVSYPFAMRRGGGGGGGGGGVASSKGRARSAGDILDYDGGVDEGEMESGRRRDPYGLYQAVSEGELLQSEIMDGLFDGIDLDCDEDGDLPDEDEFGDDPATNIELERIEMDALDSPVVLPSPTYYTAVRHHNPRTGEGLHPAQQSCSSHEGGITAAMAAKHPAAVARLEKGGGGGGGGGGAVFPKFSLQERFPVGEYTRNRYNSLDSAFRLNNNSNNGGALRNSPGKGGGGGGGGSRRISDSSAASSNRSANLYFSASLGFTDSAIMKKSSSNSSSPIAGGSKEMLFPSHHHHPSIDEVAQEM